MVILQSYAIVIVCLMVFIATLNNISIIATPEDPKKKTQTCHKSLTNFILTLPPDLHPLYRGTIQGPLYVELVLQNYVQ